MTVTLTVRQPPTTNKRSHRASALSGVLSSLQAWAHFVLHVGLMKQASKQTPIAKIATLKYFGEI